MSSLPIFYYPTTILWVDDNNDFIKTVEIILSSFKFKSFNRPQDCLSFFSRYKTIFTQLELLRGCTDNDYYESVNHTPVDFNVPALSQMINYSDRHQEIAVMIIDYKMPGMNGIELCRKLKELPIKKILLTGEANAKEAIAAFNDKIIDRFIPKNSKTLINDIENYILNLNQEYFSERTQGVLMHLEADRRTPLTDPVFIKFFDEWRRTNLIREFYLIDKIGSMLTVNNKNEIHYFILHNDHSLNTFTTLYQEEPSEIISKIKSREKIPFFGVGREAWEFNPETWPDYFYQSNMLKGRENYYWQTIKL